MRDIVSLLPSGLTLSEKWALIGALSDMVAAELAGRPGGAPAACPRCGHAHVVRRGRAGGAQRWLCRGCGRTFGARTMSLVGRPGLPAWKWSRACWLFVCRATPGASAAEMSVSLRTAWFVRARLCELVASRLPAFVSGPGSRCEVDGTYLRESFTGNPAPCGHAGRFSLPRPAHRRGATGTTGVSMPRVCVLCGTDGRGGAFAELASRSSCGRDRAAELLAARISEGTVVDTDGHRSYPPALRALAVLGVSHRAHPRREGHAVQSVNALHASLRDFMRPFRGVATRRLPLYLAWFLWQRWQRRGPTATSAGLAEEAARGTYRTSWRESVAAERPFMEYWEAAMSK